ncbi:MAG: hypothetical protein GXO18_02875 [Aquificae bacterium]|nr:hypothetical protein [Aquificota bacterium]
MDGDAFLFMIVSWAFILGLNIFCFTLLFTRQEKIEETAPPCEPDREDEIT